MFDGCLIEDRENGSAEQILFFKLLLLKYLLFCDLFDGCLIENPKNDSEKQVQFCNLLLYKYLLFCDLFDGCLMESQMTIDTIERGAEVLT